jgi:hypothetical protein
MKRADLRISLTLHAADEGYAVAEVFEVGAGHARDEAAFAALEELAERIDAQAVVMSGPVDRARVEDVAGRVRLMVFETGAWRR